MLLTGEIETSEHLATLTHDLGHFHSFLKQLVNAANSNVRHPLLLPVLEGLTFHGNIAERFLYPGRPIFIPAIWCVI